jgi:putative transposase
MGNYKTELDPTNKQRTMFLRNAGVARFAYNWALSRKVEEYQATGNHLRSSALCKEFNVLKRKSLVDGGFPWVCDCSKSSPEKAIQNLDKAFDLFFRRCKSGVGQKGFPKFKSRKKGIGSFTLVDPIKVTSSKIWLTRIGWVRIKERDYLPADEYITSATISECCGRWFVSVRTKEEQTRPRGSEALGVDVGIKSLAVLSDGTMFENPRALKSAECKLKHLQRSLARKKKGSQNRKKAVLKLARQHYKVLCIRKNSTHQVSSVITNRALLLGVEDLNVEGMKKSHKIAKAVSDASVSELLRQIEYKMKWSGGTVVKVDRWYPSSKTCSVCGFVLDTLSLKTREWTCPQCGVHHDRDVNAACNLRNVAVSSTVENACGGLGRSAPPVKQEPTTTGVLWEQVDKCWGTDRRGTGSVMLCDALLNSAAFIDTAGGGK